MKLSISVCRENSPNHHPKVPYTYQGGKVSKAKPVAYKRGRKVIALLRPEADRYRDGDVAVSEDGGAHFYAAAVHGQFSPVAHRNNFHLVCPGLKDERGDVVRARQSLTYCGETYTAVKGFNLPEGSVESLPTPVTISRIFRKDTLTFYVEMRQYVGVWPVEIWRLYHDRQSPLLPMMIDRVTGDTRQVRLHTPGGVLAVAVREQWANWNGTALEECELSEYVIEDGGDTIALRSN